MIKTTVSFRAILICLCFWATSVVAQDSFLALQQQTIENANAFLQSLDASQRNQASFDFSSDERKNWHFIPRDRQGIAFNVLSDNQGRLALALLQGLLSDTGYRKVEQIRSLESVLAAIEVNGRFIRDPDRYYFTVFGTPNMEAPWGFRFEGHHIALNWTFAAGLGLASSPQFFGTNPARVLEGPQAGLRVLAREEDLARQLILSMTSEQRTDAIIAGAAPRDIITGAEVVINPLSATGISYSELEASQREILLALIQEVAGAQADNLAMQRMQAIRATGLESIRFTWIGDLEPGGPHYYRIQGSGFLVEYDNTQNDANHIHLVWRDFSGDFGDDLLRMHYDSVARMYGPGHGH